MPRRSPAPRNRRPALAPAALAALALCLPWGASRAQGAPRAAAAPEPAASAPQRVEIQGNAPSTEGTEERRRAIAGRITIGREELDRMGDQSLGEVLKRLPGVTMGGPPGRGAGVRMRGMGGGYTQILIDGQRMPPGFSLESIAPEQIERIEIMRAPVAEHGTRAIAGTINVVLKADFKRKSNEVRVGAGLDGDRPQVGATLQRNGQTDALGYNLTATVFDNRQATENDTRTRWLDETGAPALLQSQHNETRVHNRGLFANGRLAWKLGGGDTLELQPFFNTVRSQTAGQGRLVETLRSPLLGNAADPVYTAADWTTRGQWQMGRLMGVYQATLGSGGKLQTNFGTTLSRSRYETDRDETGGPAERLKHADTSARDLSVDWKGKFSQLLADRHSASAGWELQANRRQDQSSTTLNGLPDPSDVDFGTTFTANVRRAALFAQDEWEWSRSLSYYVGARWEGIETRGDSTDGPVRNRSGVFTPLAHLVYKLDGPDGKPGRDQVRASLTRSYRNPNTNQMIGRRSIPALAPVGADRKGTNSEDRPDREGNPDLKPELAWGLELGIEHYLDGGGLLAANLFLRRIDNVIRNVTSKQVVSYADVQRWVSQPVNLGRADAAGVELEAKLRASDLWATELPLSLRANVSLLWSRVDGVPGPDNRLEGQPPYTLNLGADLPLRGTPLTVGGNLNWTPGFRVQQFDAQSSSAGVKRQLDAYALWRLNADASLRLSLTNLAARGYDSGTAYVQQTGAVRASDVTTRTYTVVNLRAELRF